MDYIVISASEIVENYRNFCEENFPGHFLHFYDSIESQLAGDGMCKTCQSSQLAQMFGPCKPESELRAGSEVQLMISGSPCDPFSMQRATRWLDGSVKSHHQYDVTFQQVIGLYKRHEPHKGIVEQVWGFTMPYSPTSTETPKDRQDSSKICFNIGKLTNSLSIGGGFSNSMDVRGSSNSSIGGTWYLVHITYAYL